MKIGEISRLTGVSISTIRYYIKLGLLVPDEGQGQYIFNEIGCKSIQVITKLKNWGFSLEEIYRVLSMRRFTVGVETEESKDYLELLMARSQSLKDEIARLSQCASEIDKEILSFSASAPKSIHTGVPLRMMNLICCPDCHESLQISNVNMDSRYIYDASLSCPCGYRAEIRNGILYSKNLQPDSHDKADVERALYRTCPSELMSLVQKSSNWMTAQLEKLPHFNGRVILESHLNSFFYLYKFFTQAGSCDDLYIVQDKFCEIVELYKRYIDRMGLDLHILYIVSNDSALPVRENIVDILVDYNSTNEYGIFSNRFYLDVMRPYLKSCASVIGTYFYFSPFSSSIRNLRASYPKNHPDNYTLPYFRNGITKYYRLSDLKEIGFSLDSGSGITFIFHQKGDQLFLSSYLLKVR